MADKVKYSLQLAFYGLLLTENQRHIMHLYLDEDLSLGEIAQNQGISRQGVYDAIRRAQSTLEQTEARLMLTQKYLASLKLAERARQAALAVVPANEKDKTHMEQVLSVLEQLTALWEDESWPLKD